VSVELASREWPVLRFAMAALAAVILLDVVVWKVRDVTADKPTRLELAVLCLRYEKGLTVAVPAGSPLADSARAGSLSTPIDGNEVHVALASSDDEALRIEGNYRGLEGDLEGRLERRGRSVYLWAGVSTPTGRQTVYDCQY
jgi:hypothetical protein